MAHVLVVDDDEDIRTSMRAVLEEIGGHSVVEAANGVRGLAELRASKERLVVLLDLLMPELDGIGVLRAVAADERLARRHAYVLVSVSRRATPEQLPENLPFPVSVVAKPFDITTLLDTVAAAERRLAETVGS